MLPQEVLQTYFGYTTFRKGQQEIVNTLLQHRDVLCVMPTGAGKSLCYQIPALCMSGITLVISPLISLMKDQVTSLVQSGVHTAFLNSSLTAAQLDKAMFNMSQGMYKIIYVAPERLLTKRFLECISKIEISMIAVDEAHCISQWGQSFRPDYLDIAKLIHLFRRRPVIGAFTATATDKVKEDIVRLLELQDPYSLTTGFNRENLFFGIVRSTDKDNDLLSLIRKYKGRCGIVYCSTRAAVEEVCTLLNSKGFSAVRYHAGLSEKERKQNQEDFTMDRCQIVVATNAFGMGIDKSNVSFVIHYHMPMSIEAYYQEAGRAGRDGEAADCILLYSKEDLRLNTFLIERSAPNPDFTKAMQKKIRASQLKRLDAMRDYCATQQCLRRHLLKYFGEESPHYCGNCSSCQQNFQRKDITTEAQKILSCIFRTEQRYGIKTIIDILQGNETETTVRNSFSSLSVYGIMEEYSNREMHNLMNTLKEQDYIEIGDQPYYVVKMKPSAIPVLKGQRQVYYMQYVTAKERTEKTMDSVSLALFDILKQTRSEIAREYKIPAYTIFSDAELRRMALQKPLTNAAMKKMPGVGKKKFKYYGKQFVTVIQTFMQEIR